jgi:Pilus formation protein N terminal region
MQTLTLGLLLATAGVTNLKLTMGWPTMLDLADVQSVQSDDPRVVFASRLDDRQVLLLGARPGVTRLVVEVGPAGHTRRLEYEARVERWATVTPPGQHVEAEVDVEQVVELAQLQRVVSGDPTICEASLLGADRLRLLSRRPGRAVMMLWVGGTDAAHRRSLVVNATGGVERTQDDVEAILTEPLDGRLALIAGEHARVPVPGTRRFESRDPSVAFARLHPSGELLVEARGVGATWVQTWAEDGTPSRLWVVVNHHSAWDPHSIDWLLRLEAERREAKEAAEPKPAPTPLEVRSLEAPGRTSPE